MTGAKNETNSDAVPARHWIVSTMFIVRPTPCDTIAQTVVSSFQKLAPVEPVDPILRSNEEATCPKLIPLSHIPEY
jgi:hypothetical protein